MAAPRHTKRRRQSVYCLRTLDGHHPWHLYHWTCTGGQNSVAGLQWYQAYGCTRSKGTRCCCLSIFTQNQVPFSSAPKPPTAVAFGQPNPPRWIASWHLSLHGATFHIPFDVTDSDYAFGVQFNITTWSQCTTMRGWTLCTTGEFLPASFINLHLITIFCRNGNEWFRKTPNKEANGRWLQCVVLCIWC